MVSCTLGQGRMYHLLTRQLGKLTEPSFKIMYDSDYVKTEKMTPQPCFIDVRMSRKTERDYADFSFTSLVEPRLKRI